VALALAGSESLAPPLVIRVVIVVVIVTEHIIIIIILLHHGRDRVIPKQNVTNSKGDVASEDIILCTVYSLLQKLLFYILSSKGIRNTVGNTTRHRFRGLF